MISSPAYQRPRRARVEARAREIVAEEQTLSDLRKALDLTQAKVGAVLGIGQAHVSRLEQRSAMLLSTLAGYVKAMGGDLKLVVEFPDRPAVRIANLGNVQETTRAPAGSRGRT